MRLGLAIHYNWTKTSRVKSAAQLICTPKSAQGAKNWCVIWFNLLTVRPLQNQTSRAINHISPDLARIQNCTHSQFCLMFSYSHYRAQTRQNIQLTKWPFPYCESLYIWCRRKCISSVAPFLIWRVSIILLSRETQLCYINWGKMRRARQ